MPTDKQKVKILKKIKDSTTNLQKKVNDMCDGNIKLLEESIESLETPSPVTSKK